MPGSPPLPRGRRAAAISTWSGCWGRTSPTPTRLGASSASWPGSSGAHACCCAPGAASAGSRARAAVCTSRRRQVMIATVQYATDYRMSANAKVSPCALRFGDYLPAIQTCPCKALYSVEPPGRFPRCPLHPGPSDP